MCGVIKREGVVFLVYSMTMFGGEDYFWCNVFEPVDLFEYVDLVEGVSGCWVCLLIFCVVVWLWAWL